MARTGNWRVEPTRSLELTASKNETRESKMTRNERRKTKMNERDDEDEAILAVDGGN